MSALLIEDLVMSPARKTRRVNFEADIEMHNALKQAGYRDHLSISDRMRALTAIWYEDAELQQRVLAKASELAEQRDREREEEA